MLSVIVPAFNEEKNIKPTIINIIKAAKKTGNVKLEIVVVNDGSVDKTGNIIKKLQKKYPFIKIISHAKNMGLGMSIRDALKKIKYSKFMIVPGDNDAALELLKSLIKNRNKADLILSYFLNKENRSKKRNIFSAIYQLVYMNVFDIFIMYQNGINIYPTKVIRKFNLKAKRFSIIAELVVKTLRRGCSYFEVAGYMQTGEEGSKSLNWRSLFEISITFLRLLYEIKIRNRKLFCHSPVRIYS